MQARILIIDDDVKVTKFLQRSLLFEGYSTITANDGMAGLNLACRHQPDLVVLDVMMPGMDGIEVCRTLRKQSSVPILLLTAKDEVGDRVKGLDAGADDYLIKPFSLEELLARVRAQLRRVRAGEDDRLSFADVTVNTKTREVQRDGSDIRLTAKEFQLLCLFLRHPGQVLTKEQIMERVWGFDYSGESNVLEVYINMLRQKLEQQGGKRLIRTVHGVGYVLKETD